MLNAAREAISVINSAFIYCVIRMGLDALHKSSLVHRLIAGSVLGMELSAVVFHKIEG